MREEDGQRSGLVTHFPFQPAPFLKTGSPARGVGFGPHSGAQSGPAPLRLVPAHR
jgi:hypothetical protein